MAPNFIVFRLLLFFAGSLSVGSLVLYFFGVAPFSLLCVTLSVIEIGIMAFLTRWAWTQNWADGKRLLISGLWAGLLATLAYDIVRVPIVHGGVPVFKAVSYFGTVLLDQDRPTTVGSVRVPRSLFNPGSDGTVPIGFELNRPGLARVPICDRNGIVARQISCNSAAGRVRATWDGRDDASVSARTCQRNARPFAEAKL